MLRLLATLATVRVKCVCVCVFSVCVCVFSVCVCVCVCVCVYLYIFKRYFIHDRTTELIAIHVKTRFTSKSTPNTKSLTYTTTALFSLPTRARQKIIFDFLLQISVFDFLFSVEPHGFPLSVCPLMKPPRNLPQKLSHRFRKQTAT